MNSLKDIIKSVGIDIGTTTTQIIFSKLVISDTTGYGVIPKVEIISKDIIYKSPIYFTPLLNKHEIDGMAVRKIIEKEYERAKINPDELSTGAVIITGESSRKDNAKSIITAISSLAGNFVVTIAGPKQEAILAGKGSGADTYSAAIGKVVANLDIGGGTTNISIFDHGKFVDATCLDIGGRLIKYQNGKITYIAEKLETFLSAMNIHLNLGDELNSKVASYITNAMSYILALAVGIETPGDGLPDKIVNSKEDWLDYFLVNDRLKIKADILTFSGGVADCIWQEQDEFMYNDIGVFLGRSIRNNQYLSPYFGRKTKETLRATVVGAGNYSMDITGCTIEYSNCHLPIKSVPVYYLDWDNNNYGQLSIELDKHLCLMKEELLDDQPVAVAMNGPKCPSFDEIEAISDVLYNGLNPFTKDKRLIIIILKNDIGKALGQALKRRFDKETAFICMDGICCNHGSYIDVGEPLAGGKVLPVVIKTLIFNI